MNKQKTNKKQLTLCLRAGNGLAWLGQLFNIKIEVSKIGQLLDVDREQYGRIGNFYRF